MDLVSNSSSPAALTRSGPDPVHNDGLSDGFPVRMAVLLVVMAVTISIFLAIAALGPKSRFYDYRPTETNDKFAPLSVDLDDEDEDEADVLFDAGRHKLLRKSGPTV